MKINTIITVLTIMFLSVSLNAQSTTKWSQTDSPKADKTMSQLQMEKALIMPNEIGFITDWELKKYWERDRIRVCHADGGCVFPKDGPIVIDPIFKPYIDSRNGIFNKVNNKDKK